MWMKPLSVTNHICSNFICIRSRHIFFFVIFVHFYILLCANRFGEKISIFVDAFLSINCAFICRKND